MTCQTSSLEPALPEQPEPAQCHKWPRLPRKTKVAVSKCHAGHAKVMDEPAEKQGWMNQSQSESLLAQGKSAQLSWTKRSTAMPVLCSRARNGTCAQGKCSWCHKAASSLCHKTTFFGTSANSWAPGTHTRGELNSKKGEGKLFEQSETTSFGARYDNAKQRETWTDFKLGTHTRHKYAPVFFVSAKVICGARDFFPPWVKIQLSIHGTSGWPMPSFAAMPATSMNDFSVSCWSQRNSCRSQTNPSKFLCDLHEFVCNLGGLVCSLSTLAVICSTFVLHPCGNYNCKASKPRAQSLGWHRTRRCCNHSCYMQEHQPQACSNRKQYRWFSLPTVAYQMQWVHINPCVQNAFEVSKPCFFGTPDNSWAPSWAPGNHTREVWDPKTGVKENYSEGLKRRAHWRSHAAQASTRWSVTR